jgi:hypothetical protein
VANNNKFITPSVVSRLAYAALYKTVVMAGLVFRDYDSDFDGQVGDTITVRQPAVFEAKKYSREAGLEVQKAEEKSFTVKLDTLLDVSFGVTSEQWTLSIADFNEQLIVPAIKAFKQKIDALLLAQALADVTQTVGKTSGRKWDDPRALIDAGMVLDQALVPEEDRYAVIGPETYAGWIDEDLTNNADRSGSTAGLRKAEIGELFNFGTFKSQGIVKPAGEGKTEESVAFHRSAFALVCRSLAIPKGAAHASSFGADGVGFRTVFDYNSNAKEDIVSIDTLVGTKTLDAKRAVLIRGT